MNLYQTIPFEALRSPNQLLELNGSQGGELIGKNGTRITVPPAAFITLDGKPELGMLNLELHEALNKKEIVCSSLQTVTHDGKLLETGGMVFLDAKAGGQPLKLASGKLLMVEVPTTKLDERMLVWDGQELNGKLVWLNPRNRETPVGSVESGDKKATEIKEEMAGNNKTAYTFSLQKLGWTNLDHLDLGENTKRMNLEVLLENSADYSNLSSALVLKNRNVTRLGVKTRSGNYSFNNELDHSLELPAGEKALLIFSGYKGNEPYLGIREITLGEKELEKITLEKTTTQEMDKKLDRML